MGAWRLGVTNPIWGPASRLGVGEGIGFVRGTRESSTAYIVNQVCVTSGNEL
jgi:hypothetical protein